MDSRKRDESRDRRREEALARRMGDALDQLAHRDAGECPDAELIAAYHEKSLESDEIARWEGHVADCGRCRKILAVLSAGVETPLADNEVAHLGELVATARPVARTRPIRSAWRTRWLAPALGVAAVLAVWFAMRPLWRTVGQSPSGTLIAQGPRIEPPPSPETPPMRRSAETASGKTAGADAEVLRDRLAARPQSPNPATDSLGKKRLDDGQVIGGFEPGDRTAENRLRDEKKEKIEPNGSPFGGATREASGALPGAPSPPPPAPPAPMARQTQLFPQAQARAQIKATEEAPQIPAAPRPATQSNVVTESVPSVSNAAGAASGIAGNSSPREKQALAAPVGAGDKATAKSGANMPLNGRNFRVPSSLQATSANTSQIRAPSGSTFWRVGKGGSIERSTDAGRTWVLQASSSQDDWLAGGAVSDTICWLVGRNGAIAQTTDGEHWEKIAPPPQAQDSSGKFPDWMNIVPTGAQTATITATDQRRYVTLDGGKTWRALP